MAQHRSSWGICASMVCRRRPSVDLPYWMACVGQALMQRMHW